MKHRPRVAIVGRPNVGKSTLFNRLLGRKQSIVHDVPGVTRDRITGEARLDGDERVEIVDTGGLLAAEDLLGINHQVDLAVEESDLLLFVVDGVAGLTAADQEVGERLRSTGKPIFVVVNKSDTREAKERASEFHRLGIEPQLLLSAEHGRGIEDLRQALATALPQSAEEPDDPSAPAVAIVGRPNVGKSSLLNRLLGVERVVVSPVAGTTRDPVDTLLVRGESRYLLVDTAGIRRRSRVSGTPEDVAVLLARRQIERASVALLVVDASAGVTAGDLTIAGLIWEAGRATVVGVNKWDLLDPERRQRFDLSWGRLGELLAEPLRVNISAHTGRGVEKLFPAIDHTLAGYRTTLATAEVNRLFEKIVTRHRPPSDKGHPWKLYYATQVSTGPPTFMLFANRPLPLQHPYRRYLENRLRDELDLPGIPLRLVIRQR